jgi:hypothetical protein
MRPDDSNDKSTSSEAVSVPVLVMYSMMGLGEMTTLRTLSGGRFGGDTAAALLSCALSPLKWRYASKKPSKTAASTIEIQRIIFLFMAKILDF